MTRNLKGPTGALLSVDANSTDGKPDEADIFMPSGAKSEYWESDDDEEDMERKPDAARFLEDYRALAVASNRRKGSAGARKEPY